MPPITRRAAVLGSLSLAPAFAMAGVAAEPTASPDEAWLAGLLARRIDVEKQSVGMALGVLDASGERALGHGALAADDARTPDAHTPFAIGSITKVFTAILLMDAVARGEMRLDDPLTQHLPEGTVAPSYDGRPITLVDLATHTAGLPVNPDDFPPETDLEAQSRYTREQLFAFLARHRLAAAPGSTWLYSNLGPVFLREALELRTGLDYSTLLRTRIFEPLGLTGTATSYDALTDEQKARAASGHDARLRRLPPEPPSILAGAGGMWSTASDLLRLLGAFMGIVETPLAPSLRAMLDVRRSMRPALDGEQAVALQVFGQGDGVQIVHAGSTTGFASEIGWRPGRLAVVVLSNAAPPVLDLGAHVLDPSLPLAEPIRVAAAAGPDAGRVMGRYLSDTGMLFVVAREGDVLTFEAVGGAPKVEIEPVSDGVYLVPRLGVQLTFGGAPPEPAQTIRFEYGGVAYEGKRTEE